MNDPDTLDLEQQTVDSSLVSGTSSSYNNPTATIQAEISDDDTVDEAAELVKMSTDPPAEDPPFAQSSHAHAEYPTSDDEEVIDEEVIEEEIVTDGEETIEEEIIEEEYTEGSLRNQEEAIKQTTMGDIPEDASASRSTAYEKPQEVPPAAAATVAAVDAPASPVPDATASPTRASKPKMDNDLAAFMERRRKAADGEAGEGASHMEEERTQHLSNVSGKEEESVPGVASVADESKPDPTSAPPPPAAVPSLYEQQRSYEQPQQHPYRQDEMEEEHALPAVAGAAVGGAAMYEQQQQQASASQQHPYRQEPEADEQDRSGVVAPAVAGAAVGGAAMYYAQQQENEPVDLDDEEYEEEEVEDAPPVSTYQASPYQSQQSPYQSQPSPYQTAAAAPMVQSRGIDDDIETGDDDKARSMQEQPVQASTGPTWGCFMLCCIIALLLCGAGVVMGIYLSDDDDEPATRDITIDQPTPAPGAPTPPGPTAAPTIPPIRTIPMEAGRQIVGPAQLGFGASIAVSSNKLSVGAPVNETGSVFHYAEIGEAWQGFQELPGGSPNSEFGYSLDMNGVNSLIVGAPEDAPRGRSIATGSAYFYSFSPQEGWELQGEPMQNVFTANIGERFGEAVAISSTNDRAAIGAPAYGDGAGRIYMYELTDGEWTQMDDPIEGENGAGLGSAVDMSENGRIVAVGAPAGENFYVFEWQQGQWLQALKEDGVTGAGIGTSVAVLSDTYIAVSLPRVFENRGIIRLYTKSEGRWTQIEDDIIGEFGQSIGGRGLLTGSVSSNGDPEVTFGTANGLVRRFDYISGRWGERFTVDTGLASLSSLAIDKASDTVKVWAGSSATGEIFEYTQVITPAPTLPLTSAPTLSPTTSPTLTMAPTTETKSPTQSPTAAPTGIPVGSGWVAFSGPFSGPAENMGFGTAVAIEGNIMATGSPDFSLGMGAVQVYRKVGTEWMSMATIYDDDTMAFGSSLDISVGSQWTSMVVGAPETRGTGDYTTLDFGSFQMLELTNGQWSAIGQLVRPPELNTLTASGNFGAAVAVAANPRRVAVGAPGTSINAANIRNGRVYTYAYDGSAYVEYATALEGEASFASFGSAVAMNSDGTRLLVGAPGEGAVAGAAFYYRLDGDAWRIMFALGGDTADEKLGTTVAIISDDGDTIAMGAPAFDGGRGVVRVYQKQDPNSPFFTDLPPIEGEAGDALGTSLSGANGRVVVGTANGSFKVYRYVAGAWVQEDEGPTTGAPVVSIAANSETEVVVGLDNEQVAVYGLF